MEDEKIVDLYWDRNESAIDETQRKYGAYLNQIAYNILSDMSDSEESVNDAYLAAWNSMPSHRPSALRTYLGKLTRRISIDLLRKRTSQKRQGSQYDLSLTELEDCVAGGTTPEDSIQAQDLAQAINRYLRSLKEDARNVFIGRYYYLDPVKDVADYCGMTEGKAKTLLYRTRCGLREYLKQEGFDL